MLSISAKEAPIIKNKQKPKLLTPPGANMTPETTKEMIHGLGGLHTSLILPKQIAAIYLVRYVTYIVGDAVSYNNVCLLLE